MSNLKSSSPERPTKPFEEAILDFLSMSKDQPQDRIVRYFFEQVILHSNLSEQGSIQIYDCHTRKSSCEDGALKLVDHQTNNNSKAKFVEKDFSIDEGLAGLAFRKRSIVYTAKPESHPDYINDKEQDIGEIFVAPVILSNSELPYGVVSFHNTKSNPDRMNDVIQKHMIIATRVLETALATSQKHILTEKIFIVHGRSENRLKELVDILGKVGIEAVVIRDFVRTGQDLLGSIEKGVRGCTAGFVLLTPDDEGRLYQFGKPLRQRARQNVIFEAGYLTALFRKSNNICFLQEGDMEIPSDLKGLLMERFGSKLDRNRIEKTLLDWGFELKSPKQRDGGGLSRCPRLAYI